MNEDNTVYRLIGKAELDHEFDLSVTEESNVSDLLTLFRMSDPSIYGSVSHAEYDPGKLFLPIPVNPSDPVRKEMITNTFIFGDEGNIYEYELQKKLRENSINYSRESVFEFVVNAMEKAKAVRKSVGDQTTFHRQTTEKMLYIEGEKGVGKTHLQNYILSEYSKDFDKEKILWVRVNLVRGFGQGDDLNLTLWVRSQVAKVLCRYYDKDSEYYVSKPKALRLNSKELLEEYINANLTGEFKLHMLERMMTMIGRFQQKNIDRDLDPLWLPEFLVEQIFKHAIEKMKLNIVVVIDGLDLLSKATISKQKHKLRLKSLENYLVQETSHKCFHLIFVRPNTRIELSRMKGQKQGISTIHEDDDYRHVCSVDAEQIYRKRIDFLWNDKNILKLSSGQVKQFTEFIQNGESDLVDGDGRKLKWIEVIKSLSGSDARTATQVMSSIATIAHGLANTERIHSYELIECAMLGRRAFPPTRYIYVKEGGNLSRLLDLRAHVYDTIFIPSIFGFPFDKDASASDVFGLEGKGKFLISLRILQCLFFVKSTSTNQINSEEVIDFLGAIYGYSRSTLSLQLEELLEAEVVSGLPKTIGADSIRIGDYLINLSVKGERLLSHFIYDITYLALAMFTIPLPTNYMLKPKNKDRLFSLKSPQTSTPKDWIKTKVKNSLAMFSILNSANNSQVEMIERMSSKDRNDILRELGQSSLKSVVDDFLNPASPVYKFTAHMKEQISSQCIRSIEGHKGENVSNEIMKELSKELGLG